MSTTENKPAFNKYSSLTNHYENRFMEKILYAGLTADNVQWVAHEKIHGTNFSLITTDGKTVTAAKRSGPILPSESFYGHEIALARYSEAVRNLYLLHRVEFSTVADAERVTVVQVFGEFAGGGIQQGIDYGDKDFYVFDIVIDGEYMDDDYVEYLCARLHLKRPPKLKVGTYAEIMAIDNSFSSLVKQANECRTSVLYSWIDSVVFGEDAPNLAEGFVAKPNRAAWIGHDRVAIKSKSPKFSEKKNKVVRVVKALSEADQDKLADVAVYLTVQRVHNVLSKLDKSTLTAKDFGRITGLTVQDALEEIARNEGDFVTLFEDPGRAKKEFVSEASGIVRSIWNDVLAGNV